MSDKIGKYIIIDTETTGLHPNKHGLIQLAAIALEKDLEVVSSFNVDVRPPDTVAIAPESLEINHFTAERISNGISYADTASMFLEFLEANFDEKPMAVGQFYPFDFAVLENVFTSVGYEDKIMQTWLGNDFIDTKGLANALNLKAKIHGRPLPFPSTSLSKPEGLRKILNLSPYLTVHDALGDVLATREALVKLLNYLP